MLTKFIISMVQLVGWLLATALMVLMPLVNKVLAMLTGIAFFRWATADTPITYAIGLLALLMLAKSYPTWVRKLLTIYRKDKLTTKNV